TLELAYRQIDEAHSAGLDFVLDFGLLARSVAHIGLREFGPAQRSLEEVNRRSRSLSTNLQASARLIGAKLRIATGDLDRASVILQEDPAPSLPRALIGEFSAYRGLVHAAEGRATEAEHAFAHA